MQYWQIPLSRLRRFCVSFSAVVFLLVPAWLKADERPNILWITCEDMSADLGCYGDTYSRSPNIDKFATEGVRYTQCYSHAGVCAPSRSGIITGMYPCSIGSHHMRSKIENPPKCFPEYLREAGYYCTNNIKTDYNFDTPAGVWDANGKNAHWKNRKPDQPFFAIFNLQVTHESQIRAPEKEYQKNTSQLTPDQRHDPALAKLPPYYPDTPAVRKDWARYHDNITAMDYQFAAHLKDLADAGLLKNTIVFFYSDHGRGLPRGKRWLYDSGLRVPLLVRWPEQLRSEATHSTDWKPGSTCDDLVAFVDLAPTVLSLAGVKISDSFQGQAFLGAAKAKTPREYIYGARDRMDERIDFIRAVRDARFKYIRNYDPWKPYAQNIGYMNEMPTMQEWRKVAAEVKLTEPQKLFMASEKPAEELYDCQADPYEVRNLIDDPAQKATLARLRKAHASWVGEIKDLGFVPEAVLADFRRRQNEPGNDCDEVLRELRMFREETPDPIFLSGKNGRDLIASLLRHDPNAAQSSGRTALRIQLAENLGHRWKGRPDASVQLIELLQAPELSVRITAAEAFVDSSRPKNGGKFGEADAATIARVRPIYLEGLRSDKPVLRHWAALGIDALGPNAAEFLPEIEAMLQIDKAYAARIGEHIVATRKP